jgi:hypothetical protein
MVNASPLDRQEPAWRRWQRLSQHERRLLLQAMVVLPAMTGAVSMLRVERILAWVGLRPLTGKERGSSGSGLSSTAAAADRQLAGDVGRAIARVGARTPWTSTCLARALAAAWLLGKRGVPVRLTLGVAGSAARREGKPGPGPAAIDAHAWLEAAGVKVTGESPGRVFQPLARFASAESPR